MTVPLTFTAPAIVEGKRRARGEIIAPYDCQPAPLSGELIVAHHAFESGELLFQRSDRERSPRDRAHVVTRCRLSITALVD